MTDVQAWPLLQAALHYARKGWFVLPLHTPLDGICDCPKKAACDSPGKHPRTLNGLKDATSDLDKVRRWWTIWPHANIGVDLWRSNIVDVAPDSIEWEAEFIARGLPDTLTFSSGGGDGHRHYLYRRRETTPGMRITESGRYDILSSGYAVFPPSLHCSGRRYRWL